MAFFDGGILSNDASTPVAGSAFEVLDLRTMSPMVIQYEADLNLTTSRYRNHLAAWKDKILSVGGQYDDSNGASQQVINVIELDLNTRQWALRKQFTQPAGQVEVIIEAAVVADDQLLVVFVTLDPINPLRNFLTLNLNTQKVPFNYNLASDPVHLFDWPLIGIMTLGQDGNFPHLVVQSKRQLPSANNNVTLWYEVTGQGEYGVEGPLPFNASTSYKKLPGGDGGKVLAMKIFRILDKPRLITWAVTTATFPDGRKETVNAVSMYDVDVSGPAGQRSISLQLSKIFLTLPFNTSDFSGLQSVDLPLHGNLALTAAGVTALPYVGQVDLVGELDFTNINIQEWPGKGFIIRGSSLADHQCQPIASWKPFVLTIDLSATASPATSSANSAIRAVSNNTWCSTRSQQLTASEIVDDASGLMTNAKLFTVDSSEGPMLMMLNMKRAVNPGGQLSLPDTQAPLRGAFISVSDSTVHNFSIPAARDYSYALGFASCVTSMAGSHVYLQTGGQFLDEKTGDQRVDPNFVAVPLQVGKEEQPMLKVGGASSGQGAIFPALACSPDGTVYTFGGLVIDHYENQTYVGEDGKAIPYQEAVWAASNRLTAAKLSGSLTAPALSKPQQLGPVAAAHSSVGNVPSPRNGHTLTYLPAETVAALGLSKGALLLYGGSNVTDPGLSALLQSEVQIASVLGRHTAFDRSLWLYDLGASQWINQLAAGRSYAPPGLMYHSAVVQGKQVLLWGGSRFIPSSGTMRVSTDLYILDFAESTPRWRKAAVHSINTLGGFQLGFPNTGAAVLPQSGVIALMHKSGISLAAIPQSVQTSAHSLLPKWGYQTLNLTAGDWVRIDVTKDYGLKLEKPLVLNSNTNGVLFTAAEAALPVDTDFAEGPSTQRYARPVLQCGGNATTALMLRSSEAVVEGFKITGCNGSGIVVVASSTGYQVPATLRNFHIAHNTGHEGAALYVGPDAAVVLQDCLINDNDGTDSIIHVSAGAQLELVNTNITSNHGSGVVSAGSRLTISGCKFSHNTAIPPGAKATSGNLSPSSSGAAVRMTCGTPVYAGCQASITNSTFTQNRAQSMGGAMYFGANTYVNLVGCTFSGHMATEGGAVYADRSSCLANMTAVHFMDNHASQRGGAVMMRGASCLNNIVWHNATFVKNSASTQGGAMCLVEMINERIFGQAAFHNNMVASAPAADNVWSPTALGQGGGAMYLALWGSNVTIYNTTFVGNNAVGSGGAVEVLSIDYSVVDMINTTAVGNYAGSTAWNNSGMFGQAATSQAATSEGGVVHMQGPAGWLTLSHVNMTANKAGRGGAVSVTTGQGGFNSSFSSFRDNIALIAGGAVAVTEHKAAALYLTRFERNRLLWPHIAAGGGFYCYLCERVGIMGSYFTSNVASFGGGAAILRPFRPSTIVQTAFVDNVAIALPSLMSDDQAQHMRRLLSASSRQLSAAGTELHNTSADFLGPLGNTTGDAAIYSGGGGLYLSVTSLVDIAGSCFSSNVARNGGGLVASTDSCQAYHNKDQPCQLRLWNTSIMLSNNATSAGAGLLITKVDAISVDLGDCQAGNPLNFTTCVASLQKPSKLCPDKPSDWRTAASHTDLLSTPSSSNTADYASEYFVTSAASLKCFQRLSPTGVPQISEDCSDPVAATPGGPIDMVVQLYDGLARPVYGGVDGKMSLEVVIFNPDGITRPNFFLIGNTTQAVNGSGYFPGLRINGSPGTHYLLSVRTPSSELAFRTKNGLSRTRPLLLRECQPGEHNSTQKVLSEESYTCEPCGSPQYSFYPQAQTCGSCPMLGLNRYSICNMAAVVPADGMYQSHPRNPLLHRCITAAACSRSSDTPDRMADWAAQHAGKNITQLNQVNNATGQPYYQPYMELMCASGYTGPLCGACSPGYGHSSYRCVKCMNSSANSFCYFMVCLFMFLVPALQTLLHSKDIQKRHKQHRQTAGLGLRLGSARSTSLALGPQGSFQEGLKPSLIAEQGSGVIEQLQQDKNVELVSTEGLGNQRLYGQGVTTVDDTAATQDRDQSHVVLSLTPYNGNSVPAAAAVHAVDSSNTSRSRDSEVSGHVQQMSHTRTGAIMDIGTFSRGADAATQGLPSGSMQQQQQQPPTRTQAADAEPKQPAGLLSAMFSTRPLHRADTVVKRSGSAATPLSSTGVPASAAVSKSAGSSADVKSAGLSAAAGCAGTPHLRFYHTDVLTMLVSYMQLLGLLRLIELDWREWLKAVQSTLTYLDFTSGVSTWVSVECSFSDAGLLPKSLKRSLVLLMWPLVALLFLAIIWLSYAYISTHFRRSPHRLMSLIRRLVPYMVLSALTIVYYLYTPTSREILTLFSCQPVDTIEALQGIAPEYNSTPDAVDALLALTPASSRWQGVWMSDTNVSCSSPAHMGIALGLGIPGLIFWVFGVPIALWVVLKRNSRSNEEGVSKLEDPKVELMFGVFYEKYRYKRYYWECVVLLQNCTLTMLLVLLQPQPAALQVLVAMAVIFIFIVLQVSFKPYAVQLLDTLRQLAMYALLATLFCMMLVSLTELQQRSGLPLAALIVIFLLNLGVVLLHIWAICSELSRWIVYEQLTWGGIGQRFRQALLKVCGGKLAGVVNRLHRPPVPASRPGMGPV